MAVDHGFAQRAHAFLQQLLSFMDKTIKKPALQIQQSTTWPSVTPTTSTQPVIERPPFNTGVYSQMREGVRMPMNGIQEMGNGIGHAGATDLYALFDYTQDLTQNLGDQLENFDTVGVGMWSWEGNNYGAPQAGV